MSSTITFRNARKEYLTDNGVVVALDGLDLEVKKRETVCLIGTSGSGKTTALKMINRLIEPTKGTVSVDDSDVSDLDVIALRRSIGYVIQRGGLFPHMTVAENIGLICRLEGIEKSKVRARVDELLSLVNLPAGKYARRRPGELSGGQQQRVSIARALALEPGILLMDEPFGALDPITRNELHIEFQKLNRLLGKTTLIVTHDLAEAFKLGDRIVLLDRGKAVQTGTEKDFVDHPANAFVKKFVEAHSSGGLV